MDSGDFIGTQRSVSLSDPSIAGSSGGARGDASAGNDLVEMMLNDNGMIRECSRACGKLLGCLPTELIWRPVSDFLPQLAGIPLMLGKQINPRLRFLSHIGQPFEVLGVGGVHFVGEIFFNDIESLGHHYLHLVICPVKQGDDTAGCMPS